MQGVQRWTVLFLHSFTAFLEHEAYAASRLCERRVSTRAPKVFVRVSILHLQPPDEPNEAVRQIWIKLHSSFRLDLFKRLVDWPCRCVRAAVGEGVEDISERHDARVNRNSLSAELGRITGSVPPFVMEPSDVFGHAKLRDVALSEQFGTYDGVNAHNFTLCVA